MRYIEGCVSDKGYYRKTNQDCAFVIKAALGKEYILFAGICDGMGGYEMGEIASRECVNAMAGWFYNSLPELYRKSRENWKENTYKQWDLLIKQINEKLIRLGDDNNCEIGTTLVCFLFIGDAFFAVNIGDSRGYIIRDRIQQITNDQSMVDDKLRRGLLTEEESERYEFRNVLLQCIGVNQIVVPEYYSGKIEPGTGFLICSDGFWHTIKKNDIEEKLLLKSIHNSEIMHSKLSDLLDMAIDRGEKDNITAIGILVIEDDDTEYLGGESNAMNYSKNRIRIVDKMILPYQ